MPGLLDKSLLCPILVGRAPLVEALQQRIEQARAGQGQIVLLTGEAGIGKSRLVAEAKSLALQNGFTILQGQCFEPDRVLPYAPWLDLLRTHIAAHSAEPLRPFAPELIKLLPELNPLLPGVTATPPLDPEQEKRRHFQTLSQWLFGVGATQASPLHIVIEDLHWCDDTSLEFLLTLARQLATRPICLLLTYRSDDAQTNPALQHFLAETDRARLATEATLTRLSPAEVEAMIRAIFQQDQPVRAEFTETIHTLTDGNPFFIEEILKSLVAAGDIYLSQAGWTRKPVHELHIPRTVQEAVARRTEQLSEAARSVLTWAAVAGRRFDFALLQTLTQTAEVQLLGLIKELIAAQLVVEESADQFTFRHALTQQASLSGLLTRERRAHHQQIAEALEQLYGDPESHLAELARHAFEAGMWEKALMYSRRAGEKAQALYTPRAAAEHFTRALESARHLAAPAPLDVLQARGQIYQTLGEFGLARGDYQTGLDEARARGEARAEWQALIDLGFLWVSRDYTQAGDYFQRALALAPNLADPASVAQTLNRVGNWHANVEQPREAIRYHLEALRIFEALNHKPGLAATQDLLGMTHYVASDARTAVTYYEQAVTLFRELNDLGGLMSSLMMLSSRGTDYLGRTATPLKSALADRVRDGEEALRLAREMGARPGEALGQIWLGLNLAMAGEYGRALDLIRRGLQTAEDIEHRHFMATSHLILGALYRDILALPIARAHLEQAISLARETNSMVWWRASASFLASTHILLGQLDLAESVLASVFTPDLPMEAMGQRQVWAARAELLLARGEAKHALSIVEQLIESAPNANRASEAIIPYLALLRGEALTRLGKMKEAERTLQAALAVALDYGFLPIAWRLEVTLGRTYQAWGKRDAAADSLASAHALIESLAAKFAQADATLRDNFLRVATIPMGRTALDSARRKAKHESGGLTAREREVAALIAQGQSNKDIAQTLTLSPRTVEAHIANIMAKLGASSRAQIAAWAAAK